MGDGLTGPSLISYCGPQAYTFLKYFSTLSSSGPGFASDGAEGGGLAGRGALGVCEFICAIGLRAKQSQASNNKWGCLALGVLSACWQTGWELRQSDALGW
jgi:hypothetical protein